MSEKRDLNSRHPPWQGGALPLSYSRIYFMVLYYHIIFDLSRTFFNFLLVFSLFYSHFLQHYLPASCEREDSNFHTEVLDPKSSVSTNSTTLATNK